MTDKKTLRFYERYPRLTLVAASVVGILLVLAVAELVTRYFVPQWAPVTAERAKFWQFDNLLGWSQIPNQKARFQHPDFSTWVEINSRGLRDREYTRERNSKKRMLVLGDSFGWGFGVNNNEIFTELLEAKHPDWEIINASVSGYGTVQQYLYLAERGLLFQPDVVLVLFNDNDFQDSVGLSEYWYNKPVVEMRDGHYEISGLPVPPQSLHQRMDVFFLGHFYLARGLYIYLQLPVSFLADVFGTSTAQPTAANPLDATAYVLAKMIAMNQARQIQTVIVQTPLSEIKNQAIEKQCAASGITTCLHLYDVFKGGKKSQWHFQHDHHWNPTGHRMAADAIDDFLTKKHLWEQPKPLVF